MLERKLVICTCIVELVCYGYLVACYCLYRNRLALILVCYLELTIIQESVITCSTSITGINGCSGNCNSALCGLFTCGCSDGCFACSDSGNNAVLYSSGLVEGDVSYLCGSALRVCQVCACDINAAHLSSTENSLACFDSFFIGGHTGLFLCRFKKFFSTYGRCISFGRIHAVIRILYTECHVTAAIPCSDILKINTENLSSKPQIFCSRSNTVICQLELYLESIVVKQLAEELVAVFKNLNICPSTWMITNSAC